MKIYNTLPDGNDMADMASARYFNLSLKQIEENAEWLKNTNQPTQALLAHIEILTLLAKRFPVDANLCIRKDKIVEWKNIFDSWFARCSKKIPVNFREGIKNNGDELFKELEKYGHE